MRRSPRSRNRGSTPLLSGANSEEGGKPPFLPTCRVWSQWNTHQCMRHCLHPPRETPPLHQGRVFLFHGMQEGEHRRKAMRVRTPFSAEERALSKRTRRERPIARCAATRVGTLLWAEERQRTRLQPFESLRSLRAALSDRRESKGRTRNRGSTPFSGGSSEGETRKGFPPSDGARSVSAQLKAVARGSAPCKGWQCAIRLRSASLRAWQ